MQYSNYVRLMGVILLVCFLVFAGLFITLLGSVGFLLALFFGGVFLLAFSLSVAWAHRAVSEFGGSPFPGIWGILGFDITPDDPDLSDDVVDAERTALARPASGHVSESTDSVPVSSASLSPAAGQVSDGVVCPTCGNRTVGIGSRFCRMCGGPLPSISS